MAYGPRTHFAAFDSECEIAAVVYGPDDNPDELVNAFSVRLIAQGFSVEGFTQRGSCRGVGGLEVRMLASGQRVSLFEDREFCAPVRRRLAELAHAAAGELARPDLVVLNRFGKLEQQGCGLALALQLIAARGIPVLTVVADHRFAVWNAFVGGLAVKLRCQRDDLDRWWRSVAPSLPPVPDQRPASMCETLK